MDQDQNIKGIVNFIYEMEMLKRHKHDGYSLAGVSSSELPSIAEHTLRSAMIGYILARMENYPNPYEIVTMIVFHDVEEARIPDINKVANRYIEKVDKDKLLKEQLDERMGKIGKEIREMRLRVNYWNPNDTAGVIAKDADYLEQAFTAKEFLEKGYISAYEWIENIGKSLRSKSALKLWEILKETNSWEWWDGLKKIDTLRKD